MDDSVQYDRQCWSAVDGRFDNEISGGSMPRSQSKGSPAKSAPAASKKQTVGRVLIDGLTKDQDELLQSVQYKSGLLAGRDSLYLATRQYIEETDSDIEQPTKRQVGAWLKG